MASNDLLEDVDVDWLKSEAAKIRREVHRLVLQPDSASLWHHCKSSRAGEVYKSILPINDAHSKGHTFKGEAFVDMPVHQVHDLVHPTGHMRPLWDPFIFRCSVLKTVDDDITLVHHRFKPQLMGILSARESIDLVVIEETADYSATLLGSVTMDQIPVEPKYVRAWSYPTGIVVFKTENPNRSRICTIMQADLKLPLLPISFLEYAIPTMSLQYVQALQKAATSVPYKPTPTILTDAHNQMLVAM